MEANVKKCCPNCSQFYQLKSFDSKSCNNIPLFLSCGHSMCENCVRNIVKFAEPIECKICHKDMHVSANDLASLIQNQISLHKLFPVNIPLVGDLTMQMFEAQNKEKVIDEYFLDIKSLVKQTESSEGKCLECHGATSKMCLQCEITLCNNCFNKTHKNFVIFKNHVLQNIDTALQKNTCKLHDEKPLDYYCKDCSKSICMDCLMVGGEKSCKNHNITSIQEVNESILSEVTDISPKVDETFKRLTKTAVDIGHLLTKIYDETSSTEYTTLINNIEQHFSKLNSVILKQKDEVINFVLKLKHSEKESLIQAKKDVAEAIKKANNALNTINALDPSKLKQMNISVVYEEAKQIVDTPWHLYQDKSENPLTLIVNDEICSKLNNYIKLEGKENSQFKLLTTKDLMDNNIDIPPPPTTVVYPPQMIKDVRQMQKPLAEKELAKASTFYKKVPQYRSKSGSCSSLNSIHSESSSKSYQSYDRHQYQRIVEPVTPFPESQHPKQLYEGSQELIYISHIVDPHNLYVQRACQQPRVEELLREFRNAVSMPKPSVSHVFEGKVYLVFNKADNLWQRCRVVSIDRRDVNKPLFHVFCIDFGSTEVVSIDKLRLLPPARIQSPPPFAIHCRLANCEPLGAAWTSDDAFLIQKIIDNKQAVIYIRRIRSSAGGAVSLECDISAYETGVSLARALEFHKRARIPHKIPYPTMIGVTEKPKLFVSNSDYKLKSVEEVYITHIVSPDNFYVRKRHLQGIYEKLHEELEQEYSLSTNSGSIYLPEKDMVCVVNVEKCGLRHTRWARAIVKELPGSTRVRVLLPDSGHNVLLHWTALRYIQHKFTTLRALATECHLAGVTPHNKKWNPRSVALLQKYEDQVIELHVEENRNRNSLGVTLYDKSDKEDIICINELMIKYKFAVSFGLFMFNTNTETEDLVITNKSPLDKPKPTHEPKENSVKILKKHATPKPPKEQDLEAKDKGPLRLEVKVLNYQSPSLLYVSIVHQQKLFNELYEKIQKYYSEKKTQGKERWKVGDRCCTICIQSQTWRRAAVLEIQDDNAKVFYSDFACVETVPLSSLREMPQEFASCGDAAIMCHLCGVIPAVGEEWPSLTKEYLKELLDAYNRIFVTKLGDFKGKSLPVELWVYHTIQGGALEPNTSEWRCLNKKIIEQGLGIPDRSEAVVGAENIAENTGDDTLSFLNITGSIRDWLQMEPMPMKPLKIKSESESNSSTPVNIDTDKDEDTVNSNTIFISDWLPPEPLPSTEFTAMPTYIDNNGVIYLHDVSQQDTLDLIRKALDVRFNKPDPKAKYVKWNVGEPCIALYFLDNRFYRGKIIEVNDETSSCLIHYIDYGNEENCSFENLRKSIALHQIPIQAHKCVLDRIKPVDKKWDRQTLDYIHKSIVEKHCYVKVSGQPMGDLVPVELKYDKLWINDHLVEFEMAAYTDGSKALVRKYAPIKNDTENLEVSYTESDSGPDYIIEYEDAEDQSSESLASINAKSLEGKDWNQIIEEDEKRSINGNFITYCPFTRTEFLCNVSLLNEVDKLELSVIHDDDTTKAYETMFGQLQSEAKNMLALDGIFENKACVALFPEDGQWYRASILEYSEAKNRIKVKYVDYGNIEIISLADVREIKEKYTRLPPATITATLYGVTVNPDLDKKELIPHFTETFLDKGPFHAKIIDTTSVIPGVELRNDDQNFIYADLIEKEIFLKYD